MLAWMLTLCALAVALTRGGWVASPALDRAHAPETLSAGAVTLAAMLFPWLTRSWGTVGVAGAWVMASLAVTSAGSRGIDGGVVSAGVYVTAFLGVLRLWSPLVPRRASAELLAAGVATSTVVMSAAALYLRAEFAPTPPASWAWALSPVSAAAISASARGSVGGGLSAGLHFPPLASIACLALLGGLGAALARWRSGR